MINVLVRVDANLNIGFGHLSRCINLCRHWRIQRPTFNFLFCGNFNEYALNSLEENGFNYLLLSQVDYSLPSDTCLSSSDVLILDSYLLTQELLNLYTNYNLFSIFISDLPEFDYSSVSCVVNFRLNADSQYSYNSNLSFLGTDYLIVNPLLVDIRMRRLSQNNLSGLDRCSHLLLFFGGGFSDDHFVSKLISIIHDINPEIKIFHLTSRKYCFHSNYHPVLPGKRLYSLLESCDTLITGGGLIKYEGCYSIIPVGSFSSSPLQLADSHQLSQAYLHQDFGLTSQIDDDNVCAHLSKLLLDSETRQSLRDCCINSFLPSPTQNLISNLLQAYEQFQATSF